MMFFLFNLPAVVFVFFLLHYYIPQIMFEDALMDLLVRLIIGSIFICIPVITVGPVQAGFTYILRNYSREEHAFLWWDFKDAFKDNFKQGMLVSLIDLFVVFIIGFDLNIYGTMTSNIKPIASGMLVMFFVIYVMMHFYIYPMMVTFKLSTRQLYKNAFIFAVMKFIPNLLILVLVAGLVLASFYFNSLIGAVLFPFLTYSLTGLIINFYVYPQLKKYMIDKIEQADGAGNAEEGTIAGEEISSGAEGNAAVDDSSTEENDKAENTNGDVDSAEENSGK